MLTPFSFTITLTFGYELNNSIQVGDEVYWTAVNDSAGFTHGHPNSAVIHIGEIISINFVTNTITVLSYHTDQTTGDPLPGISPPIDSFISFSKNNIVNNNDLTGYYSSVQFVNNSFIKAELFSVSSDVSESSK